jgi:hypothetical protein
MLRESSMRTARKVLSRHGCLDDQNWPEQADEHHPSVAILQSGQDDAVAHAAATLEPAIRHDRQQHGRDGQDRGDLRTRRG